MGKQKVELFIDADDTLLESSEEVINILNKRYGLNKTINDMVDWNYRSICHEASREEINCIYSSREFYDNVKIAGGFDEAVMGDDIKDDVVVNIVTIGDPLNLMYKEMRIKRIYDFVTYYGIKFTSDGTFNKSMINMKGGICIDDRIDCLRSCNASVKILLTHGREMPWAKKEDCVGIENLYIVDNWKEAGVIIRYCIKNPEILNDNIEMLEIID